MRERWVYSSAIAKIHAATATLPVWSEHDATRSNLGQPPGSCHERSRTFPIATKPVTDLLNIGKKYLERALLCCMYRVSKATFRNLNKYGNRKVLLRSGSGAASLLASDFNFQNKGGRGLGEEHDPTWERSSRFFDLVLDWFAVRGICGQRAVGERRIWGQRSSEGGAALCFIDFSRWQAVVGRPQTASAWVYLGVNGQHTAQLEAALICFFGLVAFHIRCFLLA